MAEQQSLTTETTFSSILDDQPAKDDYLGFDFYVQALYDSIVDETTKTPLTLGIFGRWGTGKTTLMRMLEEKFSEKGMITVWFNAWQYGQEDELWAAFLQSIINKIQESQGFFRRVSFQIRLLYWRVRWRDIPGAIAQYLLRAIVAIIPLLLVDPLTGVVQPGFRVIIQAGGNIAVAVLATWLVAKPLVEAVRENVTIDFGAFRQESDYQKHIAFLDKFREHFTDIVKSLPSTNDKRLAVFVDDLDRCSSNRVLQVLDAVKLFVDIPGCIYILGLDADVVQKAVETKYKDDPLSQKEYLGKIVQLPFQLPPLTRQQMMGLLGGLSLVLPDDRCSDVFVTGLVANPREIKRAINIFSLLWNLVKVQPKLSDNIKPVRLAKVVVIQHGYPELHKLLQQRPDLLIELERHFRQEQAYAQAIAQPSESASIEEVLETQEQADAKLRSRLLQLLTQHFNEEELRTLFFHLDVDYEMLAGEGKASKARELIAHLGRRKRIPDLINAINRERPSIVTDDMMPKELELPEESVETPSLPSKPSDLEPFVRNDKLRRMLLLQDLVANDVCNFVNLDPADVEEYFTLTSRAEAPSVDSKEATSTTLGVG